MLLRRCGADVTKRRLPPCKCALFAAGCAAACYMASVAMMNWSALARLPAAAHKRRNCRRAAAQRRSGWCYGARNRRVSGCRRDPLSQNAVAGHRARRYRPWILSSRTTRAFLGGTVLRDEGHYYWEWTSSTWHPCHTAARAAQNVIIVDTIIRIPPPLVISQKDCSVSRGTFRGLEGESGHLLNGWR